MHFVEVLIASGNYYHCKRKNITKNKQQKNINTYNANNHYLPLQKQLGENLVKDNKKSKVKR